MSAPTTKQEGANSAPSQDEINAEIARRQADLADRILDAIDLLEANGYTVKLGAPVAARATRNGPTADPAEVDAFFRTLILPGHTEPISNKEIADIIGVGPSVISVVRSTRPGADRWSAALFQERKALLTSWLDGINAQHAALEAARARRQAKA